jgi:hypothetical protein
MLDADENVVGRRPLAAGDPSSPAYIRVPAQAASPGTARIRQPLAIDADLAVVQRLRLVQGVLQACLGAGVNGMCPVGRSPMAW